MSEDTANPVASLSFPPEIREEMQELIARVGGEFWAREGLEPSMKSLATMAVLCTRGQHDELAIHVRLGQEQFNVTREQICALILHCALYAGFPAAVAGFRTAARVFEEMDAE